VFILLGKVVTQ